MQNKIIFNSQLSVFGARYISKTVIIPAGKEFTAQNQRNLIFAELFEQFMLYDKIAIKIDRQNLPLYFLLKELGLPRVEELIEKKIIELLLWSPIIGMKTGTKREDGTIDQSTIFDGKPPLFSGHHSDSDFNPEANLDILLNRFSLTRESKRRFIRKALKQYKLPNLEIAEKSAEIVMGAYKENKLANLDLAYIKEPEELDFDERAKLLNLGSDVLVTTVLADKGYLSNNNFAHLSLLKDSVVQIESALKVESNNSRIFQIENIPLLKQLVLDGVIEFNSVFELRKKSVVKNYREWIHSVSNKSDSLSITKDYIDEISGKNNFFETNKGKLIRNVGMYGLGIGLGSVLGGIPGLVAGGVIVKGAEIGLGLFDSFVLDGLLKGWNPQMFIEEIDQLTKKDK